MNELDRESVMSVTDAIEKIIKAYRSYYNIHRFDGGESMIKEGSPDKGKSDQEVEKHIFDTDLPLAVRADFYQTEQRYMVSKKAELWSTSCEEFLYIFRADRFTMEIFSKCKDYAYSDGYDRMNIGPGHMSSYITTVFVCSSYDADALEALRKLRIYKSFRFSLHGWMDFHTIAIILDEEGKIVNNRSGRNTGKLMKKILYSRKKGKERK